MSLTVWMPPHREFVNDEPRETLGQAAFEGFFCGMMTVVFLGWVWLITYVLWRIL